MPSEDSENYIWLACSCDGQFLERDDDITIVRGQVAKILVTFTTSTEWDDTKILARFKNDATVYDIYLEDDGSVTIPHEITDIVGTFQIALYGETPEGRALTSTPITVNVIETIFYNDLGQPDPATPSILSQILNSESSRQSAEDARAQAEQNRASAETTRQQEFEEAIENAEAATLAANTAAALANNHVPIVSVTGEDLVHVTSNDYGANMQEAHIYGATRQNLWVNPNGSASGVTVTNNKDGSLTVNGNSTSAITFGTNGRIYALKKSTTYTLKLDKNTENFTIDVREFDETDSTVGSQHVATKDGITFTTNEAMSYVLFRIIINSGVTVSGTYHIMLNEGSTAEPWCPPGLTSVEDLDVVSAGKNLWNGYTTNQSSDYGSIGYLLTPLVLGETYYISFSCTPGWVGYINENITTSYRPLNGTNGTVQATFTLNNTIDDKEYVDDYLVLIKSEIISGIQPNLRNIQLEFGSTKTDYKPSIVEIVKINLNGYTLNSLPDGTKDELVWNSDGSLTLIQRVESLTLTSDMPKFYTAANSFPYVISIGNRNRAGISANSAIAEGFRKCVNYVTTSEDVIFTYNVERVAFRNTAFDSQEDWDSFFEKGVKVLIKLATPIEITLPSVPMPSLPKGEFNVWASAEVPTTMDLTHSWDVNSMAQTATTKECSDSIKNLFS